MDFGGLSQQLRARPTSSQARGTDLKRKTLDDPRVDTPGQPVYERNEEVWLEKESPVRCLDEICLPDSLNLAGHGQLLGEVPHVLDQRIGIHDVELGVAEQAHVADVTRDRSEPW